MFCQYCGKEIDAGQKFCPYCGKLVDGSTGKGTSTPENAQSRPTVKPADKPKKKEKKWPIVLIIIAVLIIILIVANTNGNSDSSSIDDLAGTPEILEHTDLIQFLGTKEDRYLTITGLNQGDYPEGKDGPIDVTDGTIDLILINDKTDPDHKYTLAGLQADDADFNGEATLYDSEYRLMYSQTEKDNSDTTDYFYTNKSEDQLITVAYDGSVALIAAETESQKDISDMLSAAEVDDPWSK